MSNLGEDVLYLSVEELSARIRARELSPVDLTESFLDRIRRYGSHFNAFARVTPKLALEQARAAEAEIDCGFYRGPLHGIPYGAKDLLATAGIETSWGAAPCDGQVFEHDATVVRKLREAGAVLVGKLAMVEFAGGLGYRFANASTSGPGRNPWDVDRWTGGSSSGSGAAVAAALVAFAIGTETWGSILCPSAFCGVTGLRPSYGRVSRAGAMVSSWTFDKIGPLARSAADCRLALEAMAGPDPNDPSATNEPLRLGRTEKSLSHLRLAVLQPDFTVEGAEPEVETAFGRSVDELKAAGLSLEEAELPDFPAAELAHVILASEALSTFETFYLDGSVSRLNDPYAPYQKEIYRAITGADLVKAWRMREALQARMAEFFQDYDAIIAPNYLSVAPRIEEDLSKSLPYADPLGAIGNACGLPAIALPCGFGKGDLPVGFQIVGRPFEEDVILALGELYQRRTDFHLQRPPV